MSRRRDDIEDDDLRAEESAERGRASHWCEACHGNTGAGSPCAPDDDEQEDECTPS